MKTKTSCNSEVNIKQYSAMNITSFVHVPSFRGAGENPVAILLAVERLPAVQQRRLAKSVCISVRDVVTGRYQTQAGWMTS